MTENLAGFKGGRGWYFCWLVERRDLSTPEWWGVNGFVSEAYRACWFARREDADKLASEMSVDVIVTEHGFDIAAAK